MGKKKQWILIESSENIWKQNEKNATKFSNKFLKYKQEKSKTKNENKTRMKFTQMLKLSGSWENDWVDWWERVLRERDWKMLRVNKEKKMRVRREWTRPLGYVSNVWTMDQMWANKVSFQFFLVGKLLKTVGNYLPF